MIRARHIARLAGAASVTALTLFAWAPLAHASNGTNGNQPANQYCNGANAPCGVASPATNLVDSQFITLEGSGFPANASDLQVEECEFLGANPTSNTVCDGDTLDVQEGTDANGNYFNGPHDAAGDTGYQVYQLGSGTGPFAADPYKCDSANPCVLFIGVDQNNFSLPHAFVPIAFAPPAQVPESPFVPALPVGGAFVLFGGGYVVYRHGRKSSASAA